MKNDIREAGIFGLIIGLLVGAIITLPLAIMRGSKIGFESGYIVGQLERPTVTESEPYIESAIDEIRTLYQGMTVLASWYGAPYHGRRASNGEIYDMTRDTVAHRTLPLGTIVVLENTANGRLAIGRVTDRGPYIDGRALDVSRAIADELGMTREGLATVRMWAVRIAPGMMVAGRASEGD